MQQRKRVNLQEKLSIAIEPAQHIVLATLLFLSRKQRPIPLPRGVTQQMFVREGSSPEVQPLTLLYTIFHEKGIPLVYILLTNGTPFTHLV